MSRNPMMERKRMTLNFGHACLRNNNEVKYGTNPEDVCTISCETDKSENLLLLA